MSTMLLCRFNTVQLPDGKYQHTCQRTTCTLGPDITARPRAPFRNCNGVAEATRVFNFSIAAVQHLVNGCPTCTQEEANERLVICRSNKCGYYKKVSDDLGYCTHKLCGCSITDMRGFVSKVFWKDQHCPINLW